jgi:hypothetical protein
MRATTGATIFDVAMCAVAFGFVAFVVAFARPSSPPSHLATTATNLAVEHQAPSVAFKPVGALVSRRATPE